MNPAAMPAMAFFATLERFQRRAVRVMFARDLFTALTIAAIVIVPALLLIQLSTRLELALTAGAIISALVGAGATTYFRRPRLDETAAAIDARCERDDCLTAAVQFSGDADPVSRLVVEQGHLRLNLVTPAEVFPYEWTRHSAGLSVTAGVAVLVLMASRSLGVPHWPGVQITGGGSVSPASPSRDGATKPAVGRQARSDVSGAADAGRAARQSRSASNSAQGSIPSGTRGALAGADRDPSPPPAEAVPQSSDHSDIGSASAAMARGSRDSRGDSLSGGTATSNGSGGSGPASERATTASRSQAGGVGGGQGASRDKSVQALQKRPGADYGTRYREAAGRAEAALAREPVPAELRDTVRAYFTAIRP